MGKRISVKRVDKRVWVTKDWLTTKQKARPRKGAPIGLTWSRALPGGRQVYTSWIPRLHGKR